MRIGVVLALSVGLACVGCVSMTPEAKLQNEICWDAAKQCETRYRTLHLDRIDSEGNLSMHADAESRQELPGFSACYRAGIQSEIERRRKAGLPLPDKVNAEASADLD